MVTEVSRQATGSRQTSTPKRGRRYLIPSLQPWTNPKTHHHHHHLIYSMGMVMMAKRGVPSHTRMMLSARHHPDLVTSDEDLKALVRDLSDTDEEVALDIETCPPEKALDPRNGSIRLISVATGDLNIAVDVSTIHPGPLLDALKSRRLVLFNARFDLSFLNNDFGYEHEGEIRDLLLMHLINYFAAGERVEKKGRMYLEDPDKTEGISDLGSVAKLYLGETLDKSQQDSDWSIPNLSGAQIAYALKDTGILLPLEEALEACLCELGLLEVVDIENRALLGVTWAENNGMPFDEEAWLGLAEENATEARRLKEEINRYAPPHPKEGKEWNWNSGPQTVETLELLGYDTSQLPRTDAGKPSVSESALKSIKSPRQAREFVQAILRLQRRTEAREHLRSAVDEACQAHRS